MLKSYIYFALCMGMIVLDSFAIFTPFMLPDPKGWFETVLYIVGFILGLPLLILLNTFVFAILDSIDYRTYRN